MSRTRLLSTALVAMVLINLVTLGVLFFREPPHPERGRPEGPKALIIQRLNFDTAQVVAYEGLIRDHRRSIEQLDRRMLELRGQLYGLSATVPSDSIIHLIGDAQMEVERAHVDHFARIRKLCRPDQVPPYEALSKDLADYFRPGPPPRKEPR